MKYKIKAIIKSFFSFSIIITMIASLIAVRNTAVVASADTTYTRIRGDKFVGNDGKWYYYHGNTKVLKYSDNGSVTVETYANPDTWTDANTTLPTCANALTKFFISDGRNLTSVYCMERAVAFGDNAAASKGGLEKLYLLPAAAQEGIRLTLLFGWHDGMNSPVPNTNEDDYRIATQMLIWEYEQQIRVNPNERMSNSYGVEEDTYYRIIKGRPAESCYNYILNCIKNYYIIPSFLTNAPGTQQSYEMAYDSNTDTYSITLTDTKNTGVDLDFSSENLSVKRNGNKYIFTSKTNSNYAVSAKKKINTTAGALTTWSGSNTQTMINGASNPLTMYVRFTTPANSGLTILKTSEDNIIEGIKFQITGNGYNKTFTTDKAGVINVNLPVGTYTIKEVNVPNKYNSIASQNVTIESGKLYKLNFSNTLKPAALTVTKTSEDGRKEGFWFHLYGTALNGKEVSRYAKTNADGIATFSKVPLSNENGYSIEEYGTPNIYVAPSAQNVKISEAKSYNVSFYNSLAKGTVTVNKTSEDGNISGITFRLIGNTAAGKAINITAITDSTGTATFKNVPISGSTPYTLTEELSGANANIYISPAAKSVNVINNTNTVVNFSNIVKPINVNVIKKSSDGNVEGVWFKLTGTDIAGNTVTKYAATNSEGIASFKNIKPCNLAGYTVTEYFAPTTSKLEFTAVSNGTISNDKQSVTLMATKPGDYNIEANNTIEIPTDHTFSLMVYKEAQDKNVENAQFIAMVFATEESYNAFLNTGSTSGAAKAYVLTADAEGIASLTKETLVNKNGDTLDPNTATMHLVVFEITDKYLKDMMNQYMTATGKSESEAKSYMEGKGFKFIYDYNKYKAGYVVTKGNITNDVVASAVLRDGGVYSAHFYNSLKTADASLIKTSDDNNVNGIEFNLISETTGETFTGVTDINGNITFSNIPIGTYRLSETNPDSNCYENVKEFKVKINSTGAETTYNINDSFNITENVTISVHNKVIVSPSYGWLRIIKIAEDNNISGIKFNITGTSDAGENVNETVTTDSTGVASASLPVGSYTITELNVPDKYISPESKTVKILKSEITDINADGTNEGYGTGITNVLFENILKKGSVKITKSSEDNVIVGIEFHIYGTSDDGIEVSEYATTNEQGVAILNNIYPGTYKIEEVNVPARYKTPENKEIIVKANESANVNFNNTLKDVVKFNYKEFYYTEVIGDDYDLVINNKKYKFRLSEDHEADYNDAVTICNKETTEDFIHYIKVEDGTYNYPYTATVKDNSTILYQFYDLPTYDVNYWLETKNKEDVLINGKYFRKENKESILNTKVYPLTEIEYGSDSNAVGVSEKVNDTKINVEKTFKTFNGYKYSAAITKSESNLNQGGIVTKSNHVIIDLYYVFSESEEPVIDPIIEEPEKPAPPEDIIAGSTKLPIIYTIVMIISGIAATGLTISSIQSWKKSKKVELHS